MGACKGASFRQAPVWETRRPLRALTLGLPAVDARTIWSPGRAAIAGGSVQSGSDEDEG